MTQLRLCVPSVPVKCLSSNLPYTRIGSRGPAGLRIIESLPETRGTVALRSCLFINRHL